MVDRLLVRGVEALVRDGHAAGAASEEAGAEKPDPRLFALCAEKAGCAMEACAFVGDSLKGDILGAKAAGMMPIWLHAPAEPVDGVCRTETLEALPELLSKEF